MILPDGDAPPAADGTPSDPESSAPSVFDADGALTREFLLARGHCCENSCRNCPYGFRARAAAPRGEA